MIFKNVEELINSSVESKVIVADYIFHRKVVSLFQKNKNVKIFCYCGLEDEEEYHPSVSLFTNSFQEIVNEVSLLNSYKSPPLVTSKVFLCSKNKRFFRYKNTLEEFNLTVRLFKNVK